jgi:hypothetical protein
MSDLVVAAYAHAGIANEGLRLADEFLNKFDTLGARGPGTLFLLCIFSRSFYIFSRFLPIYEIQLFSLLMNRNQFLVVDFESIFLFHSLARDKRFRIFRNVLLHFIFYTFFNRI